MLFFFCLVLLKDGREVLFCFCLWEDIFVFRDLVVDYLIDSFYILCELDEFYLIDEELYEWVKLLNIFVNLFFIVVEFNGELVGNFDVCGSDCCVMVYIGVIGMGM